MSSGTSPLYLDERPGPVSPPGTAPPLVVDLDGTLVRTDTLFESVVLLLRQRPVLVFLLPVWLAFGKANLKRKIALHVQFSAADMPYRDDVLSYLRTQRTAGRKLVLATAADAQIARAVADHLELFDSVLCSDGQSNLKGHRKRDLLIEQFGRFGFDYIGDNKADMPVWRVSRVAHTVGRKRKIAVPADGPGPRTGEHFSGSTSSLAAWLRALRVRQWIKNVLVFAPALLAHRVDAEMLLRLTMAFLAFGLLASGSYILNDILDLAADRRHPHKRRRPFASGELAVAQGLVLSPVLIATALAVGSALGIRVFAYLSLYLVLTLSYSLFLKQRPVVDVVLLAFLYSLRLIVGGNAVHVALSPWLFQFSMFLFLSLAFAKRYSELHRLSREEEAGARTRGYRGGDLSTIHAGGIASGLMAALVMAMYVNSSDVYKLYARPHVLWAVCPILVYWVLRVWLIAGRGQLDEDPILFAFHDKVSYLSAVAVLVIGVLAVLPR